MEQRPLQQQQLGRQYLAAEGFGQWAAIPPGAHQQEQRACSRLLYKGLPTLMHALVVLYLVTDFKSHSCSGMVGCVWGLCAWCNC